MKIEVVEFYPFIKQRANTLEGSLHIYIIDEERDVRGIYVLKRKNKYWFFQPKGYNVDPETGNRVFFPINNYTSKRKNAELQKAIQTEGKKYIEGMLKNVAKK